MIGKRYDVAKLKADNPLADVIGRSVKLAREGAEFRGLCPFHSERSPSFTVKPADGFFHCFGCGAHGDVLQFVSQLHQVTFGEACAILGGERQAPDTFAPPAPEAKEAADLYAGLAPQPVALADLPAPGQPLRCWNPKRGRWTNYQPSMVFPYLDRSGQVLGVVVRIELGDGKKLTPTLRYVALPDGELAWSHMPFDKPRPLYGLDRLAADQDSPVLVVEGEKATEAARRLGLGLVVTWPGGGKSLSHVDWKPLRGRHVTIWGDADAEGANTAKGYTRPGGAFVPGLQQLSHSAGAASVRLAEWDITKPDGWDAADAERDGWTAAQCRAWLAQQTAGQDVPPDQEEPPPPEHDGGVDPADRAMDDFTVNSPEGVVPLGYADGVYFYMSRRTGAITELTPARHNQAHLMALASLPRYWERTPFKAKRGVDWIMAADFLMSACHDVGVFNPDRVRGRGAWFDDGRVVLHLGDRLSVDGVEMPVSSIKPSRFIYPSALDFPIPAAEPIGSKQALGLVELCRALPFENGESVGRLLAGWLVIAPVCGALPWRPHVWITAEHGTGKTWFIDNVVKPLIGDIGIYTQGKSTEPGLRGEIKKDARPIVFDEAETQNVRDRERIQQVLDMARAASSEQGADTHKGRSDGGVNKFHPRCAMMFGSINKAITQSADESRFLQVEMRKPPDPQVAVAAFDKIKKLHRQLMTPGFASGLLARTLANLPALRANAEVFAAAIARSGRSRRTGDTIGAMMAGTWLLGSTKIATASEADRLVAERSWIVDAVAEETEDEWEKVVQHLMQVRTRVVPLIGNRAPYEASVGQLVSTYLEWETDARGSCPDAGEALLSLGVKFEKAGGAPVRVRIAQASAPLRTAFADSTWGSSWAATLARVPEAKKGTMDRFGGFRSRYVSIPLDALVGEFDSAGSADA